VEEFEDKPKHSTWFAADQSGQIMRKVAGEKLKSKCHGAAHTYERKLSRMIHKRNRTIWAQQQLVSSQLRSQMQKFTNRVYAINPHGDAKRDLLMRFEVTMRTPLAEHHLEELLS
jgi:hypothetical protein